MYYVDNNLSKIKLKVEKYPQLPLDVKIFFVESTAQINYNAE